MSRLGRRFEILRAEGRKAFVGFVTAGDVIERGDAAPRPPEPPPPGRRSESVDPARLVGRDAALPALAAAIGRTVEIALALDAGGTDVLELGVPFSDPLADGPVIQRSSERALRLGVTLASVLEAVRQIRARGCDLPIVLFSYYNPLLAYGLERLSRDAVAAGVDGALVTDLPPEEAGEWLPHARAVGLDTIFLAAPTSPEARLERVCAASRGFIYAVSRTGVTGEQAVLSDEAGPLVARLRRHTSVPVVLGFGLSTPEQVAGAARVADGAVVGSALVRFLEEHPGGDVAERVRWLKSRL